MKFIDSTIENYCIQNSMDVPHYLDELERATYLRTLAPQMLCGKLMGRTLSFISRIIAPTCIVEIGTFTGYSSLCLAEGLTKDGELHTFEVNDELKGIIDEFHKKSSDFHKIHVHYGPGEEWLPKMDLRPDLAFLDAGKQHYTQHYELLLNMMKTGGIILVDNVLWSGKVIGTAKDEDTKSLQAFNTMLKHDTRCSQVMLPIRDGLTLLQLN